MSIKKFYCNKLLFQDVDQGIESLLKNSQFIEFPFFVNKEANEIYVKATKDLILHNSFLSTFIQNDVWKIGRGLPLNLVKKAPYDKYKPVYAPRAVLRSFQAPDLSALASPDTSQQLLSKATETEPTTEPQTEPPVVTDDLAGPEYIQMLYCDYVHKDLSIEDIEARVFKDSNQSFRVLEYFQEASKGIQLALKLREKEKKKMVPKASTGKGSKTKAKVDAKLQVYAEDQLPTELDEGSRAPETSTNTTPANVSNVDGKKKAVRDFNYYAKGVLYWTDDSAAWFTANKGMLKEFKKSLCETGVQWAADFDIINPFRLCADEKKGRELDPDDDAESMDLLKRMNKKQVDLTELLNSVMQKLKK